MKECVKCGETKEYSEFLKQKENKDGYQGNCKECQYERRRIKGRTETPEQNRSYNLKTNYGLTICDVDEIIKFQGSMCAICGTEEENEPRGLFVDHCHKTDEVRGMLCHKCNAMLGMANDNTETLKEAIRYLEAFID